MCSLKNKFVVRKPLLPMRYFFNDFSENEGLEIINLFNNIDLRNAIKINYFKLYKELETFNNKTENHKFKLVETLLNFYSRSIMRPTPFGAFCSVGSGEFSLINMKNQIRFHYNLDVNWINYVIKLLHNDNDTLLKLHLFISPKKIVEGNTVFLFKDKIVSQAISIDYTKALKIIFEITENTSSKTIDICKVLESQCSYTFDESLELLKILLNTELLYSNLSIRTPFSNSLNKIIEWFFHIDYSTTFIEKLKVVVTQIHLYEKGEFPKDIYKLMSDLTPEYEGEYFHIDTECIGYNGNASEFKYIKDLEKIHRNFLHVFEVYPPLERIKQYFLNTYNFNDEIPLKEFLFSEKSLVLLNLDVDVEIDSLLKEKLKILKQWCNTHTGEKELEVDDSILQPMKKLNYHRKNTRNYGFVLSRVNSEKFIVNSYLTGCNVESLMGRFGYFIGDYSQNSIVPSDYIVADITSISNIDPKVNNLFSHYEDNIYEICCDNIYSERNIWLDDLVVGYDSVTNEIYIKSMKHNRLIKPIQRNVVNFSGRFSRIENFLNAIKIQYAPLQQSIFNVYTSDSITTPRIVYKNSILMRATFKLSISFFELSNGKLKFTDFLKGMQCWQYNYSVPNHVGIEKFGDIQFYYLHNETHLYYLYKLLKKEKEIVFQELGFEHDEIQDEDYFVEYVCSIEHQNKREITEFRSHTEKRYVVGNFEYDDIVYVKLYTREVFVNKILVNIIGNLNKLIPECQVFFIQYWDPEFHLRIRLMHSSISKYDIVNNFFTMLNELGYLKDNTIYKYSIENYIPEINRYGGVELMECVHNHFCIETEFVIDLIRGVDSTLLTRIVIVCSYLTLTAMIPNISTLKKVLLSISRKVKVSKNIVLFLEDINLNDLELNIIKKELEHRNMSRVFNKYVESIISVAKQEPETNTKENIANSLVHMLINRVGKFVNLSENEIYKVLLLMLNDKIFRNEV